MTPRLRSAIEEVLKWAHLIVSQGYEPIGELRRSFNVEPSDDETIEDLRTEIKSLNTRLDGLLATSNVIAGQRDALRAIVQRYSESDHRHFSLCRDRFYPSMGMQDDRCNTCKAADQLLESLKPNTEGV